MISLHLPSDKLSRSVILTNGRFSCGSGWIEPFRHAQISADHRSYGECEIVWVGEDGIPPGLDQSSKRSIVDAITSFADYEGVAVIMDWNGPRPEVTIARSATGASPLYLAKTTHALTADWRYEAAVEHLPERKPNFDACRLFLEEGNCQVRDTVIDGVFSLWPGEWAEATKNGLTFHEVTDPRIVQPSVLADDARATDAFVETLAHSLGKRLSRANSPLVELSGGFDSSCVAIAARRVRPDISSYAVIQEGPIGKQQRRRRAELVSLLGFKDFEHPANAHPPFAALQDPDYHKVVNEDCYGLTCKAAVAAHPAGPFDVVMTGIGGDEITMEDTHARLAGELRGPWSSSAIVAATGRAGYYMRRGIWPLQPFIDLNVIDFCRALPPEIKYWRLLNVLMLARAGLSDGFIFRRLQENYALVLHHEGNMIDFDELFAESIIMDLGIFDLSSLLRQARLETVTTRSVVLISSLYRAAKLETVLRNYLAW